MLLAVTGFAFTVIMAVAVMMYFGYSLLNGILLGSIIGSTCTATVIAIVSKLKGIGESTRTIIELETSLTDVFCIVVALSAINTTLWGLEPISSFQFLASGFSIGAVLGLVAGIAWLPVMKRLVKFDFSYVVTLAVLLLLYSAVEILGGSGAIACLLFGVVLANGTKVYSMLTYENMGFEMDNTMKQFHSLIAFLVTAFFFVYLGLVVTVKSIDLIYIGIILSIGALLVRYAAMWISAYKGDFTALEKKVMWIMFPRGLTAAVLAYLPISMHVPGTEGFADIVFTVIVVTVIMATVGTAIIERGQGKEEKIIKIVGIGDIKIKK
jgi:cell volume regulation protein A